MIKRAVITGVGAVSPLGNDIESSWKALLEGTSGIDYIKSFDTSLFDTKFAGELKDFDPLKFMDRKEAKRTDRFIQLAVAASKMALEDSGIEITDPAEEERFGVIIGSGIGGIETHETQHSRFLKNGPGRISPFYVPMMISDMAAGYVSMMVGAKGPNFCTVSACASGGHAIGLAFRSIKYGESDLMLAGGTEGSITPMCLGGFNFVLGDGAGVILLEEYEHARARGARIYAEITGVGMTADSYHITAPPPEGEGAQRAMKLALEESGLNPEDVDCINAHGTSTEQNDLVETIAIKKVFGTHAKNGLVISSTKSMTGHLLGAAGGIEAIFTALTLKTGRIPPTINYRYPDPDCDLDYCPNQAREKTVRAALSNCFGGHNVALALKQV